MDEKKTAIEELEEKRKDFKVNAFMNIMLYVGFGLAGLVGIVYLMLLYIIIEGFEVKIDSNGLIVILGLSALAGIMISLALRTQGIAYAKQTEEAKAVDKEYAKLVGKDADIKLQKMWVFELTNILKDVFVKGLSIATTLYLSFTLIVEGIGDMQYLLLGVSNVVLYFGLGLVGMVKAYNFYNDNQIPLIKQKIERLKTKEKEKVKNELLRETKGVSRGNVREDGRPETIRKAASDQRRHYISRRRIKGNYRKVKTAIVGA